jgi:hypothetical protein
VACILASDVRKPSSMGDSGFRGRPAVAEAARAIGASLSGRSAPRPLLPSRGRICGRRPRTASLRWQARLERVQGRGGEASAYQRRLA